MTNLRTDLPKMYSRWLGAAWPRLTGSASALPKEPTPRAEQAAADQEWEHEGGALKPAAETGAKPGTKLPS